MFNSGFLTVARFAGAPVRVHWSVVLLMLYFGGFRPGAWVGIVVLVMVHELGHAVLVRLVGAHVTEVMVYGFGGYCGWRGFVTDRGRALIAWGGVLAQGIVYAFAIAIRPSVDLYDPFTFALFDSLTRANLFLIAINLLPIPPLDGASAWPLVPILWSDLRRWATARPRDRRPTSPARPPAAPPSAAQGDPSPPSETGDGEDGSSRVTDPEVAERMFQRVYKGLVSDQKPSDDEQN